MMGGRRTKESCIVEYAARDGAWCLFIWADFGKFGQSCALDAIDTEQSRVFLVTWVWRTKNAASANQDQQYHMYTNRKGNGRIGFMDNKR